MKIIYAKNEQKMSEYAMQIILGNLYQDKKVNLSLTSGRSPRTLYKMLAPEIKERKELSNVRYFWFDDSPYKGETYGKNFDEMKEIFAEPAGINLDEIVHPNLENYEEFDKIIESYGGIDLMVIGLGYDGHFCGNLPESTEIDSYTYAVNYNEVRKDNPDFEYRERNPILITMGPNSLMKVRHLVMIVNGEEKAEIFKRFLEEPVHKENPCTALKMHPNFTVIVDDDAAKLVDIEKYL